ncbi:hypothetical protein GCM10023206_10040 [Acinetobacter puyangensis]
MNALRIDSVYKEMEIITDKSNYTTICMIFIIQIQFGHIYIRAYATI